MFVYYKHYQLYDKAYPYLYFYSILIVAEEVFQREILLQTPEKDFYLPSPSVNFSYGFWFLFKIVGNVNICFLVFFMPENNSSYYEGLVSQTYLDFFVL